MGVDRNLAQLLLPFRYQLMLIALPYTFGATNQPGQLELEIVYVLNSFILICWHHYAGVKIISGKLSITCKIGYRMVTRLAGESFIFCFTVYQVLTAEQLKWIINL